MKPITLEDVYEAQERIAPYILDTELSFSRSCSERAGSSIFLKHENLQRTGSFKVRGALNKILKLTDQEKKNGLVASSAGNHAQGVAYAAAQAGVKATIFMPESAPKVKIAATRFYGAEVVLKGNGYDEAYQYAQEFMKEHKAQFIHPYADPDIIAGQGTTGLELLKEDFDAIVIAVGGGGQLSGVSVAIKNLRPDCKIYGVTPVNVPTVRATYKKESLDQKNFLPTVADGVSVRTPDLDMNKIYFGSYVDDIVSVTEEEIYDTILFLLERGKTLVEGAGALSLAAILNGKIPLPHRTAAILSGGNIDLELLARIINSRKK